MCKWFVKPEHADDADGGGKPEAEACGGRADAKITEGLKDVISKTASLVYLKTADGKLGCGLRAFALFIKDLDRPLPARGREPFSSPR